jgi:NAD(P)-dependent dehydrogenase (short-subunit alcohol dehydrogenase family)
VAEALAGQVAIVSGAARGIGRAAAYRLAVDGARVALFDRDGASVHAGAESLAADGLHAVPYVVDVTDEGGVNEATSTVLDRDGRIDILVNNAGIYPHTPFEQVSFAEWRRVLATNLDGVYLCTKAVWPAMVRQGYGRIVNISSATFHIGYPEMVPYISSKGGVVGFTRGLAAEAGAHGVTVNCITPGLVETEGTQVEDPTGELFEEIVGGQAVKRRGRPDDIAACIAYLASPAAGFITGQTINVDGGHRLH